MDLHQAMIRAVEILLKSLDDNLSQAVTNLSLDIFTQYPSIGALPNTVLTIIRPIAYTIITICFLLEFLKSISRMDILKWETAFRIIVKFVIAKAAIDLSWDFLIAIYQTGMDIITNLANGAFPYTGGSGGSVGGSIGVITNPNAPFFGAGYFTAQALRSVMVFMGPIQAVPVVIFAGIVFLAALAVGVVINIIAFARAFEIAIYCAISPIPVAFLPLEEGGGSRITKNFFLNFAAVVFQGVLIVIILRVYNTFSMEVLQPALNDANILSINMAANNAWWHAITGGPYMLEAFGVILEVSGALLLCLLVLIMAILKSGQMAKSIFNAN